MLDEVSFNLLLKTRFEENEARVYLAILQLGTASVSEIAETAELKRTTIYPIIESLLAQGYVNVVPVSKVRRYTAVDPAALAAELEAVSRDFKEMLPYLRGMQRKAGKPHVTYYNGSNGARKAWAQIKRPREARYAVSISKIKKFVPDEVERWRKLYLKGKARPGGKHLLCNTIEDRLYGRAIEKAEQLVRYLGKGQELDMDLALVDNMVFLTAFDENIHVTVIESSALYRSLCILYDLAWKAAREK